MASTLGAFSRIFSQKCRIFCAGAARPSLLNSGRRSLPWVQQCQQFSDDLPSKPKRPVSSFFQFVAEHRPKIVASNPDLSVTEITKRIGAMWREMPDADKEVYRTGFESRQNRFLEEMDDFKSRLTDEQLDRMTEMSREKRQMRAKRRRRSEMKKLNKPKRPPSGYSLFVKSHFNSAPRPAGGHTRDDITGLFKEAAEMWKSLPDYERQQYNEEAATLTEMYREEMEDWKRKMEDEGHKI